MKSRRSRAKQSPTRHSRNNLGNDPRLRAINAFGGTLFRKARYRCSRPLSTTKPIHLVLRSSQAKGSKSFQANKNWKNIEKLCFEFAARYKVQIERYVNGGSHLHLIIRLKDRLSYAPFIRSLTGAIALKITGANRHQANDTKFWDFRPFTTILEGHDKLYNLAKDYVTLKLFRDLHLIPKLTPASLKNWRTNTS
ncbi:MAG: transposase [Bdellovibrio sp.]